MKLSKSLFLAFAGLGLFACSNEYVVENGGIEGNASVSVKIADPTLSRSLPATNFSSSTEVILNKITLTLTAQTGGATKTFALTDYENDRAKLLAAVNSYQFEGVRNPSKMEVFINDGKETGLTNAFVCDKGLAEPLYASSTEFVNKGDTDSDNIDEYEVQLAPKHTVARLEFGGIKHVDSKDCMFKTITIDGLFLNGISEFPTPESWADVIDIDEEGEDTEEIPVNSVIGEAFAEYSDGTPVWPATAEQCYGYNILPDQLPTLTVCFSNITIDTSKPEYVGVVWGNPEGKGYATVDNYILDESAREQYGEAFGIDDNGVISKFPAGYIYQIKDLSIPDEAIGTTITGAEDLHIYAIVTVSPYVIVGGSVTWN